MAWQPQEDGLRQLSEWLRDSLSGYDRARQKNAEQNLINARSSPDYVNYLTYIFTTQQLGQLGLQGATLFSVRYAAGINLKNFIKAFYTSIPKTTLAYIKSAILNNLQDSNPQLRGFTGTVITETVQQGGLLQWPEILQELLSLVEGNVPPDTQVGAMLALAKVCDDNRKLLDKEYDGQRPMTVIVPKLLDFAGDKTPRIRVAALQTLKAFIPQKSQTFLSMLDVYLGKIFQLATDPDVQVRRIVCQSLVALVESKPEMLAPHLDGLVGYILAQQQTSNSPELALDAAEFWLSIGEQEHLRGLMGPYLQQVIPVLLAGMVYGEDDVARLGGDQDDADQDDRAEDLKPIFAQVKAGRGAMGAANGLTNGSNAGTPNGTSTPAADLSDGEIEEEEEDDLDDDDPENIWSLRKCSAAALDTMAVNFHSPVFDIILPYLKENLQHPLWPKREAAVLALGAIAEGCIDVVAPHLPDLIPFLISLLSDEEPVVRQITCWCLGRYSEWASHLDSSDEKKRYFEPMMQGLLERMLDKNKKVQEAAASAFASLEEKSGDKLIPYTGAILNQFTLCFTRYKDKNMYIIYDCIQTLADSVQGELAKPDLVQLLMPVLTDRWNHTPDDSREMFPLLGCLGYVAAAYGDVFAPYAPPIFARCIKIIYETLNSHMAFVTGQSIDEPDKDFIVTSLDLLSAIIQAINPATSSQLVDESNPQFFDLLSFSMQDPTPDVRQSAYALLGDCAITIYEQFEPFLPKLMPLIISQLSLDIIKDEESDTGFNVLNNVCWSCGEIGAKATGSNVPLASFAEPLYQGLITIIKTEDVPDSVNENASMALGRLGIACPEQLAGHLAEFAQDFLSSMNKVTSTHEKASAFLGFNKVVGRNPEGLGGQGVLGMYFTSVAAFPSKKAKGWGLSDGAGRAIGIGEGGEYGQVRASFGEIIQGYKQMLPDFANFFATQLSQVVQQKLRDSYAFAL